MALIAENERKAVLVEKKGLNQTGGTGVKGGHVPKATPGHSSKVGAGWDTPCSYWNKDARDRWLGLENIGQVLVNGQPVTVLIDNGTRMNTVTPSFIRQCGLEVGSIDDLN